MKTAVVHVTVTIGDDDSVNFNGVVDDPETEGWAVRELLMQMVIGSQGQDVTELSVTDIDGNTTGIA